MYSVLYVDDEPALLDLGKIFLERSGTLRIDTALSATDAIKKLKNGVYEGIISDYQMPEMDGIAFLKYLRSHGQQLPFILFTGRGREEVVIEALNSGADFYLQKGGDPTSQFAELEHKVLQAIDRQRTHIDLRESRQRMADIINFLPDATLAIDLEGKVITWNRAMEEMAGIPKEEILGTGDHSYAIPFYGKKRPLLLDFIVKNDPEITSVYPEIKQKDNKLYSEIFIQSLFGGRGAHLWFVASPLYDTNGNIIGAIESIRDITDRKEAEEALGREKELLDAIIGSIPGSFYVIDRQGRYVRWNKRQEELIGLPPEQIRSTTIFSLIHKEDRQLVEQKMAEIFEKGYADTEARFLLRDGTVKTGFLTGRRLDIGGSSYIIGTGIDITAYRLADTEARRLFQYKESVLKNTNMLVFSIDCSHRVMEWSPTAETLSGFPASEVIGSNAIWKQLYPEKEYRRQITEKINRIIRDRNYLENLETTIRCRNGNPKTILWNTRPLFDDRNGISGYLVIGVDITERRMAEDALNQAFKKLSLLSSITRHDVLNQLSALRGYLELSTRDPKNAGMLEYIGKEVAITETITQQIEFSRDYQELGISSPKWQDVMATITRAVSTISLGPVTLSVDPGEAEIYADPLLERVFYNLVENALRYGGNITRINVSIKVSAGVLVLVLGDNGIGVPLDQKENIFNRKFFHNTGLGLFLSREILSITGITITETGEPGKGARFEMTVPKGAWRGLVERQIPLPQNTNTG